MGWTYFSSTAQQKAYDTAFTKAMSTPNPYPYGMTGGQSIPLVNTTTQVALATKAATAAATAVAPLPQQPTIAPTPTPATINSTPLTPRAPTPVTNIPNVSLSVPGSSVDNPIYLGGQDFWNTTPSSPVSSSIPVGTRNGDYVWRTDATRPAGYWSYEPLAPVSQPAATTTTTVAPPPAVTATGSAGTTNNTASGSGNNVATDDLNKTLLGLLASAFQPNPVQSTLAPNLIPLDDPSASTDVAPVAATAPSGPNYGRIVLAVAVLGVIGFVWYYRTH